MFCFIMYSLFVIFDGFTDLDITATSSFIMQVEL